MGRVPTRENKKYTNRAEKLKSHDHKCKSIEKLVKIKNIIQPNGEDH